MKSVLVSSSLCCILNASSNSFARFERAASSYLLKVGDVVGVRERSKSLEIVEESLASRVNYSWLEWNGEKMEGKFLNYPERAEIPENIAEQLIVELYSK